MDIDRVPEKYRETVREFLINYYTARRAQLLEDFNVRIPPQSRKDILNSRLARNMAYIARAAAGKLKETETVRSTVMIQVNNMFDRLFSEPMTGVMIQPKNFWSSDLGQVFAQAMAWAWEEELITQTEAADLRGVSLQAINNAIRDGRLIPWKDFSAPERQGRTLVSRREVIEMDTD